MKPHSPFHDAPPGPVRRRCSRDAEDPNMPTVRSVERAGAIMETLFSEPGGLRLVELSKALGLHKTTVLRILKTLVATRMVRRTADDRYRWEPLRWLALAARVSDRASTFDLVQSLLDELARTTGQAAALCSADGSSRTVTIVSATRLGDLDLAGRLRTPLHACAVGKLFLAHFPPRELERYLRAGLEAVTPHTLCDPGRLRAELGTIRAQRYALSIEEFRAGVSGLSVPVLDDLSELSAALLLAGPKTDFTEEGVARWLPILQAAAGHLSQELYL